LGAPFLGLNAGLVLTSSDFDTGAGLLLHRGAGNAAKTHRLDPHDALCPSGYPTIGQAKAKPGGTAPDRIIVRRRRSDPRDLGLCGAAAHSWARYLLFL